MSHKDQLQKKTYRNWVKGVLALKYLRDGVKEFADELAKTEHDHMMQILGITPGSTCNLCNMKTLKPKHPSYPCPYRDCICLRKNRVNCPNAICDRICDKLMSSHIRNQPDWKNTDITKWTTNQWEISKCFINAPGYDKTTSAADTDIAGLLHLFINNTSFQGHISCVNLYEKMRDRRNTLFHSVSMELDDNQLEDDITDIITILEDKTELEQKVYSKRTVLNLKNLQREDFIITTETEAEACREGLVYINQTVTELKSVYEAAKKDIAIREEQAVLKITETAETNNKEVLKDLVVQLRERVDKHDIEISALNEKVKNIKEDLENLKRAEKERKEQQSKIDLRIALKKMLKERFRAFYIKTSVSPLKTSENKFDISDVYVSSDLKKVLYHQPKQEDDEQSKQDQKIENSERVCNYRDIFYSGGKYCRRIYILGDVGSGKSAFCKMMMSNWCKSSEEHQVLDNIDVREMKQFEFLFYLPLRTLQGCRTVLEMILQYYSNFTFDEDATRQKQTLIELLQNMSGRCIILMDALDEWKPPDKVSFWPEHETFGLPSLDGIGPVTMVTTSRPSAPGILNMRKNDFDVKLILNGITKESLESFIAKRHENLIVNDILLKLEDVQARDLEKTPLLLQHIAWLLSENQHVTDIGKSVSEVYSNVLNIALRWHAQKQKPTKELTVQDTRVATQTFQDLSFPKIITMEDFPEFFSHRNVIFVLGHIAFEILTQGYHLSFGSEKLKECGVDNDLLKEMVGTGLLTQETRFDPTPEDTHFTFTHTSFLEYFAALYIASHLRKENTLSFDACEGGTNANIFDIIFRRCQSVQDVLQLENVLVIVCGLAPSMTNDVCLVLYNAAIRDENYLMMMKTICQPNPVIYLLRHSQYSLLERKCKQLVYRCICESKLSDLEIPLVDVVLGGCFQSRELKINEKIKEHLDTSVTEKIREYVDTSTVHYLYVYCYYSFANWFVFQNLQSLYIARCRLSDYELLRLAQYLSETVTFRNIHLIDVRFCETNLAKRYLFQSFGVLSFSDNTLSPSRYNVNLSRHVQVQTLIVNGCDWAHFKNINTSNLEKCQLKDTHVLFSSISSTSETLSQMELSSLSLKHDELIYLARFLSGSRALRYISLSKISCYVHPKGKCSPSIDISKHDQLEKLEFADNSLRIVAINTSNLKQCSTDSAELLPCLRGSCNLITLSLHGLRYDRKIHEFVLTLPQIQEIQISLMDIENTVLEMILEIKHLRHIQLDFVKTEQPNWFRFLDRLITINKDMTVSGMWPPPDQYVKNYVKANTASFEILDDTSVFRFRCYKST